MKRNASYNQEGARVNRITMEKRRQEKYMNADHTTVAQNEYERTERRRVSERISVQQVSLKKESQIL